MKKHLLQLGVFLISIFCLTIISCTETKAKDVLQNKISDKNLSQTEKLVVTAKVWGFLKYYHPQVAKGKYNWDKQLFEVLEKVENAETSLELSDVFSKWIDRLGEVEKCSSCLSASTKEVFIKNFDLNWINSEIFSKELSQQLRQIERNRVQGDQHYVTTTSSGNIIVQNEPEYEDFKWKNKKLRLLTFFRYWNQVEYFFPYKYQMDRGWDKTLESLLPVFLNAESEQEFHLAMLQLTTKLNDSHAGFVSDFTNRYYGYLWAPVKLKIIAGKTVVTGMYDQDKAEKDNWQTGDILTSVDCVPVSQIIANNKKYMSGSNEAAMYRNIEISLLNGSTPSVEIEILRDGELQKKEISRYLKSKFTITKLKESKWKILQADIGYVNMGKLEPEDVKKMMKEFEDTKAIIFDLRNHPKNTISQIGNHIYTGTVPFAKFIKPDPNYPGQYTWTEPKNIGWKNRNAYKGIIILLINENTQSHGEFMVMALQKAPKVIIIGSQTSGADGNVSDISFLGKFPTYMSGIGVFYPDGMETQRVGIIPDVEVRPTIEGIKQGKDEVLEKALEVIGQKNDLIFPKTF